MRPGSMAIRRFCRLTAALAVVASLLAGFVPSALPSIAAQQGSIEIYQAEQFDYFFFYDAARWQIADESSEEGSEFVRFSDGESYVDYRAYQSAVTDEESCLNDILDSLYESPSILEIVALTQDGGAPEIVNYGSGAQTELVVTVDGADGRFKLATRENCQELEPGQSVLYTSVNVPAALWNDKQWFETPWIIGFLPTDFSRDEGAPVAIPDFTGEVIGTLDAAFRCHWDEFYVVARNIGGGANFVVSADAFAAAHADGDVAPASLTAWLYPEMPADRSLALSPGEIGLFELQVDGNPFELYYLTPDGEPVYLGTRTRCPSPAAVNAPVLIDLED